MSGGQTAHAHGAHARAPRGHVSVCRRLLRCVHTQRRRRPPARSAGPAGGTATRGQSAAGTHMPHSPRLSPGPRAARSRLARWERALPGEQVLPGVRVWRLPGAHPVVTWKRRRGKRRAFFKCLVLPSFGKWPRAAKAQATALLQTKPQSCRKEVFLLFLPPDLLGFKYFSYYFNLP